MNKYKLIKNIILIGIMLLFVGCAYYPSEQSKSIKEAQLPYIQHCTLLGQIYGTSNFAFLAMGLEMAKDRAKAQAVNIGATHVVWTEINSVGAPYALGKAYYCKY